MSADNLLDTWEAAVLWLRNQPSQRDLVMASYYDDPLPETAMRYWQSEEWLAVKQWLPVARGRALDVGAGRGIASFALAKEGFQVSALEPDGSAYVGAAAIRELASAAGMDIEVTEEFSEQLPFSDASFDVVFARAVLHHTTNLEAACREFFRVLKPGGRLIAIREHVISSKADLPVFLEIHPLHKLYGGENAFVLKQYLLAIRGAAFNIDAVLAPFDSAMNFAPYTSASLRDEIAARLSGRSSVFHKIMRKMLDIPIVWSSLRHVLSFVDHRPGRLYSFIAHRP